MDRRFFVAGTAAAAARAGSRRARAGADAAPRDPLAPRVELPAEPRHPVLRRGASLPPRRGTDRQPVPDPRLPGRGDRARRCRCWTRCRPAPWSAARPPLYYYIGKDPSLRLLHLHPLRRATIRQQGAWMKRGGGNELCAEVLRDFNCVGFLLGDTGVQMGGWFRNEVRGLSDLNGLKFRIAGMGGQIFQRLGAVAARRSPGPTSTRPWSAASIDAAEWVGPYDDEKLGFDARRPLLLRAGLLGALRARPPAGQPARLGPAAGRLQGRAGGRLRRGRAGDDGALRRSRTRWRCGAWSRRGAQLRAWPREVMQAGWRAAHELYGGDRRQERPLQAHLGKLPGRSATTSSSGSASPRTPTTTSPSRRRGAVDRAPPVTATAAPSKARASACHIGLRPARARRRRPGQRVPIGRARTRRREARPRPSTDVLEGWSSSVFAQLNGSARPQQSTAPPPASSTVDTKAWTSAAHLASRAASSDWVSGSITSSSVMSTSQVERPHATRTNRATLARGERVVAVQVALAAPPRRSARRGRACPAPAPARAGASRRRWAVSCSQP